MSMISSRAWLGTALGLLTGVLMGVWIAGSAASGDPSSLLTGPLRFFAMLIVAAIVLTSLHETAHATVGRLVGWRVFGVTIGHGRRHAVVHAGSVRVELRGLLIGGATIARATGEKWRDASMLVAGVTVETIIIVIAAVWTPTSAWAGQARWAIILVALVDIVVNLWPRRLDMGAVEGMSTDGAQLVSVFTTPEQWQRDIEQLPLTPEQALLVQTFFGGDVDEAIEMARAQVAADPTDDATSTLTGTVLLLGGHWREAFDRLAPHAAEPDADPILANNAAWAAVMTFDPSLLPWADWLSEQAFGGRPTEPACANTRGATLVLLGRPTEGLPLLELAGSGRLSRKQKASVLAFTALAEHQLGRSDDADRHLAESASNDDDCAALPEIRRLIGTVSANRSEVLQPSPWPPPNPHELIGPT